jgi:hypothetical protein
MTVDQRALDRQLQIWTNLYGPERAAALAASAAQLAAASPEFSASQVFDAVDPDDLDTYTDFVATRW